MRLLLLTLCTLGLVATSSLGLPVQANPTQSKPAASNNSISNNPLLKGVNLSADQVAKITSIQARSSDRALALLTPAQKETLRTKGSQAIQLTGDQQKQLRQIQTEAEQELVAVFTPAQLQQIRANVQSMQQSVGNSPRR